MDNLSNAAKMREELIDPVRTILAWSAGMKGTFKAPGKEDAGARVAQLEQYETGREQAEAACRKLIDLLSVCDFGSGAINKEEHSHGHTIDQRDEMEEKVNKIGEALGLTEEEATWSSSNDVGDACVDKAEELVEELKSHEGCITPCESIALQQDNHSAWQLEKARADDADRASAGMRLALVIADKWLAKLLDGMDHSDPECPHDDTCECQEIKELNTIRPAIESPLNAYDVALSEARKGSEGLTFAQLRRANLRRLPHYKNSKGLPAHAKPDGSDWLLSQWSNAVLGELGEAAGIIKKIERGDFTLEEMREKLGKELADAQTYLDILAFQAKINLGDATIGKFNEISRRIGVEVWLGSESNCAPSQLRLNNLRDAVSQYVGGHEFEIAKKANKLPGWGTGDLVAPMTCECKICEAFYAIWPLTPPNGMSGPGNEATAGGA